MPDRVLAHAAGPAGERLVASREWLFNEDAAGRTTRLWLSSYQGESLEWADSISTRGTIELAALATTGNGEAVLVGYATESGAGTTDAIFLVRFAADGSHLETRLFPNPTGDIEVSLQVGPADGFDLQFQRSLPGGDGVLTTLRADGEGRFYEATRLRYRMSPPGFALLLPLVAISAADTQLIGRAKDGLLDLDVLFSQSTLQVSLTYNGPGTSQELPILEINTVGETEGGDPDPPDPDPPNPPNPPGGG